MSTVTVRYEGGHVAEIDVPAEGTTGRYLFDQAVAAGRYTILDAPEVVEVEAPVADDDPGPDGRPAVNAPKADWLAYAEAQGADSDELATSTKADLVDKYGA